MPVAIFSCTMGVLCEMSTGWRALRLAGARSTHLFMNSNPFRFDDPQPPLWRLAFKNSQGGSQQRHCVFDTLRVWTQYPYPQVTCGGIYADIGEIEIERNENSLLCLGDAKHSWIGAPSQLLGKYGMDIVTGLPK